MHTQDNLESIYKLYEQLNVQANLIYEFVSLYNDYIGTPKDYGVGGPISMLEVHILTTINDNPGIIAAELTHIWSKTKGGISQTLKKLVQKGYIYRGVKEGNTKTIPLYVTEEGAELANAHKIFDVLDITQTLQSLKRECTDEELANFHKVLSVYIDLFKKE